MEKEIIWTEKALEDRFEIYTYWANHNKSYSFSEKLDQKIQSSIQLLSKFPTLGKKSVFHGVRMKILTHVSIFYNDQENQIIILRIWHNRKNPDELLLF